MTTTNGTGRGLYLTLTRVLRPVDPSLVRGCVPRMRERVDQDHEEAEDYCVSLGGGVRAQRNACRDC